MEARYICITLSHGQAYTFSIVRPLNWGGKNDHSFASVGRMTKECAHDHCCPIRLQDKVKKKHDNAAGPMHLAHLKFYIEIKGVIKTEQHSRESLLL